MSALERGLSVLDHLSGCADQGASAGELQLALGIPRASLSRVLSSLKNLGYVTSGMPAGRYRLGPAVERLYVARSPHARLAELGRQHLQALVGHWGCTALLLAWLGDAWFAIAKEVGPGAPPMQPLGTRDKELERTPWGRLVVAMRDRDWRPSVIDDQAATVPGLHRLAAPIIGREGSLIGALAVGGQRRTFASLTTAERRRLGRDLQRRAETLAKVLDPRAS